MNENTFGKPVEVEVRDSLEKAQLRLQRDATGAFAVRGEVRQSSAYAAISAAAVDVGGNAWIIANGGRLQRIPFAWLDAADATLGKP